MATAGRRERKKAATRRALADAALALFLERGYDEVTVAEIADAADVSVTTLFNHFPGGKPALVLDRADEQEAALVAAVRDRPTGTGPVEALWLHFADQRAAHAPEDADRMARFRELVGGHRALVEHARATWSAHEAALAEVLAATTPGADPAAAAAVAHLVVDGYLWANRQPDPDAALDHVMGVVARGADGCL